MNNAQATQASETPPESLPEFGFHETLGIMLWLCSHADYHKTWPLWAMRRDILPAIVKGHVRLYFDDTRNPVGFITWAWLSNENLERLENGESLEFSDWNSGPHLLCHDFVAPWGGAKELSQEIRSSLFPKQKEFFGIRREPDGRVRKVARFPVFRSE